MNLIDLSIKRPVFAWILMSALIIFGAISLSRMGISQLPDVDFPILDISINYEGAAPEVIEAEILDPVEERLLGIEGIKEMRSSSRQGSGSVRLEFDINRNVDVALQEVQSALSQLVLPADVDPPVIRKQNPEDDPILFVGISSDKPLLELMKWAEGDLINQLSFIPQMGEASIGGFSVRNLRVWLDPKKLKQNDLTIVDVLDTISSQHRESAAGQLVTNDKESRVRWLGEALSVEEFANMRILRRGGGLIQPNLQLRMRDVARIEDGLSDLRRMGRVDGKEAIFISIRKQRGSNEVALAESVRKKLEDIRPFIPQGVSAKVTIDFTQPTKATVFSTLEKLVLAGVVTIFVCFLFLGSLQSAINILFSIPTSMFGTFIILKFSGMTLNLFTLLALTLAISIVVDDAIMLLENIVRHWKMGKTPKQAASDGAKEILPSAIAATLSVVAIFLPVTFMDGVIGKFFFQFGITMSAAVLLSLLEAVTITPMRAAAFLSSNPKESKFERWIEHQSEALANAYRKLLIPSIKHPWKVLLFSSALFAGSFYLLKLIRTEFIPQQDQNVIILIGQTPPGTNLEVTYQKALEIEKIVRQHPDVVTSVLSVGTGGPGNSTNSIFMPTYLKNPHDRKLTHLQIMNEFREKLKDVKGVRVQMRDISARGLTTGRSFPVSFNLRGGNLDVLQAKAQEMIQELQASGLARDLDTDLKKGIPELLIRPAPNKMENLGVTREHVGRTLTAALGGVRQGRFTSDGRRYDIRVKVPEEILSSKAAILDLPVRNVFGNTLPLGQVVQVEETATIQGISRVNRQRSLSVFGNLGEGQSQATVLEKAKQIAAEKLPPGYSFALEGAASGFQESFKSLSSALWIGILVAYMILAIQFNSFVHPVVILIALPFSISGAFLALWMSGSSLNLFSFIGIIVLMGIAKKNSILMVDFTNQLREQGRDIRTALLEACPLRLRPILMTSVATVFAAIPLVVGQGMGIEARKPMGLVIIGGTVVSTLFTLVVVPALYLVMSKLERKDSET